MREIKGNGYKYEQILIIPGSYDEKEAKDAMNKIIEDWEKNELYIEEVKQLGKKQLAYVIKNEKEAYYLQIDFIAKPEIIAELERKIRLNDDVIKFVTVKKEEELYGYKKIIREDDEIINEDSDEEEEEL